MKTDKDRELFLEQLKKGPIIQVACEKLGIGRSTYYRWLEQDADFEAKVDEAMRQGFQLINDLSESQIITLIKEKKLPAIALWLKTHHPLYDPRTPARRSIAPIAVSKPKNPEEQERLADMRKVAAKYEAELRETIISKIHDTDA